MVCAVLLLLLFGGTEAQTQRRITVDELFGLVEQGSRALAVQKSGAESARLGVEEAKSERLPDIALSLSASYNGNVVMTDRNFTNAQTFESPHFGNSFALEARQTVYAGGAVNAGIRLAQLQHQQSENGVALTRSQQRFIALGQYLDLYRLANGIIVYDSNIALTAKLIDDIEAKFAQGMALKNDVTRYELQMESLKLAKRKLEDQKLIINYRLCQTLGLEGTEIVPDINLDNAGSEALTESDLQQQAARQSLQLKRSEIDTRIADQQLKLAKSEMLPKVAAVAVDNFSGPYNYDIPPINNNFNIWYVGIGVNYSFSSLYKSIRGVRRAKAQVQQSREAFRLAQESVCNEMQQAYVLHRQAFAELHTCLKNVDLANQNYQVINDRYLGQLALITDMLDASNIKLGAELEEVNARINIAYTYYNVLYVAGQL
jgi:outer membrane protein